MRPSLVLRPEALEGSDSGWWLTSASLESQRQS